MKTVKTQLVLGLAAGLLALLSAQPAMAAKVRDLARIDGARSNQLIGFGLVGGLSGTGDDPKNTPYTAEAIANLLASQGFQFDANRINVKNFAAVMVTTDLPPFVSNGDVLDVTLSAIGSAKSLSGGVLYQTLLKGADGRIYAAAQGEVSLGSQVGASGSGGRGAKPHLTAGRIPGGALVEQEVPSTMLKDDGAIKLNLREPDFTTASRMSEAINDALGGHIARAEDGGTVSVRVPAKAADDLVPFIAMLEDLDVNPGQPAKVVINQRTGTIVLGEEVEILPSAVTHGGMTLSFGRKLKGSRSDEGGRGSKAGSPEELDGPVLDGSTTAAEVALGLSKLRLSPSDVVAVFEALAASGALVGELELI
ncbi:flagellar basal body P-ring protein FlgI [bacterium]|nr:flagellar basal body P-ring protein FlgI [bacterium]